MLHIVLYQPEIPPNTGNIIRLCANTGFGLHLVQPLGFELDEPRLRRAGLDYREWASVRVHASYGCFVEAVRPVRVAMFSTRGARRHTSFEYARGDALVFGPESRGLPESILAAVPPAQRLTLPMRPGNRSVNLSNAVAVASYEAWRQLGFAGAS